MIKITANAKVNLFLEITGKLSNGYHTVDTVMQSVSLADRLYIEQIPKKDGIVITCNTEGVPTDESNIAYKTADALLKNIGADFGVSVHIEKNIPSQAGMGGGSADGAAVLCGLNQLCGNPVSDEGLLAIAASKGADIPFCIQGGTQRLIGTGTDMCERLRSPELHLVIAKPMCGISTPSAYACLDGLYNDFNDHCSMRPDALIKALTSGETGLPLFNRFESILSALCPKSEYLISFMRQNSHAALLSGSGTAVFAIADGLSHAKILARSVADKYPDYFVTTLHTVSSGCVIE